MVSLVRHPLFVTEIIRLKEFYHTFDIYAEYDLKEKIGRKGIL